jgi:ABC-type branched-subunit amino acid transport system permease subunit
LSYVLFGKPLLNVIVGPAIGAVGGALVGAVAGFLALRRTGTSS